ncbi:TetR/AcrR family transcriptional regulator [Bacillus massilinigeriensis]|uniref:TetR/AcrR family transcriptional regulator n=1 Tax=Bacillus massilionigeriensis TaxID=1805475 RepID=UPI00096B2C96|nr:TetR/AcrR family transcriptional regulator [Bacillus massilionigeriensis]
MSPRKTSHEELTKEMILDVARDLFASNGYGSISMRKIATVLKCSHGAIYYHFKNKAELFYEIIKADFNKLSNELGSVLSNIQTTDEEKLYLILYRFIEFGLNHPNHYEVMFLIRDDDVKSCLQESPYVSYMQFANAIAKLTQKPISTKDIWSIFISLHGFVTHYIRSETTFEDVKELASSHVQFLLKAIS